MAPRCEPIIPIAYFKAQSQMLPFLVFSLCLFRLTSKLTVNLRAVRSFCFVVSNIIIVEESHKTIGK